MEARLIPRTTEAQAGKIGATREEAAGAECRSVMAGHRQRFGSGSGEKGMDRPCKKSGRAGVYLRT